MNHSEIKEVNLKHCGTAAFICVTEIIQFYWKQRNCGDGVKTIKQKVREKLLPYIQLVKFSKRNKKKERKFKWKITFLKLIAPEELVYV